MRLKHKFATLIVLIAFFSCKKESTQVIDKYSKVVVKKEDKGLNIINNHKIKFTYQENLPFSISEVYLKELSLGKYAIRLYLEGDYENYNGPSYPFYLRLYANSADIQYLPKKRQKVGYDNIHFPFKVLKDQEGNPYVSVEFKTDLLRIHHLCFVVTEPVKRSNIVLYNIYNVSVEDLE